MCSVLVCTNITLTIKWWKQKWRLGLNDNAACNLNRIQMNGVQIESNWIELNLNALDGIQIHWNWTQFQKHCIDIKFNWREMRCKLIQKVLKVKRLSFLSFVYGVEKILGSKKTRTWQDTLSYQFHQFLSSNSLFIAPPANIFCSWRSRADLGEGSGYASLACTLTFEWKWKPDSLS